MPACSTSPSFTRSTTTPILPTVVIPPVSIGACCRITHSIIGPNVAIGEGTIIRSTIVSDSIIGSYSELSSAVMHDCIVGSDASFRGLNHSLNLGDNTEIDYSQARPYLGIARTL